MSGRDPLRHVRQRIGKPRQCCFVGAGIGRSLGAGRDRGKYDHHQRATAAAVSTRRRRYERENAAARTSSTNLFFVGICQFRRFDHHIGQQAAEAIMDLLSDVGFPRCGIKVEHAGFSFHRHLYDQ
jgi:hypothetical protein